MSPSSHVSGTMESSYFKEQEHEAQNFKSISTFKTPMIILQGVLDILQIRTRDDFYLFEEPFHNAVVLQEPDVLECEVQNLLYMFCRPQTPLCKLFRFLLSSLCPSLNSLHAIYYWNDLSLVLLTIIKIAQINSSMPKFYLKWVFQADNYTGCLYSYGSPP